jgi:hypothetical protein
MNKVHCHDQEYWIVKRTKCRCGTPFTRKSVGAQSLQGAPSRPVDVLHVDCESCGRIAYLEFDISSFFGKPDIRSFQKLLDDQEKLWGLYVSSVLRMESVLEYFSELAASRDVDALKYIIDAADHYLEKSTQP